MLIFFFDLRLHRLSKVMRIECLRYMEQVELKVLLANVFSTGWIASTRQKLERVYRLGVDHYYRQC